MLAVENNATSNIQTIDNTKCNQGIIKKAITKGDYIYLCEREEISTNSIKMKYKTRKLSDTILSDFSTKNTK